MPAPSGLHALCAELVAELGADACVVSRALGDVLIQVAEHVREGGTLLLGQGHLASDYPLTVEVLERHRPRTVSIADPAADPAEAGLLRALGYDALLMLPLLAGGARWGLVEVYARGRAFTPVDAAVAERLVAVRDGRFAA